jgi:hypothetical protein
VTVPKTENKPFSTRLPDSVRAELQVLAKAKGLTESDLGRMFIIEKLQEANGASRAEEARTIAAVIIAALTDKFNFEDAKQLVRENLDPEAEVDHD